MVGEDRVVMSVKELRRVHVIRQVLEKQITQSMAGEALGLTARHIRRLLQRVRAEGDTGLAHRGRGRPSNRQIQEQVRAKVLRLYETRYADFGPTLAVEKLAERYGLTISDETLRRWLTARGIDPFRRRKRPPGRGGSGDPMWGSCFSWMAHTTTGLRAGAPAVC